MSPLYREADGELYLRQIPPDAEPLDYCPDCRLRLEDCPCGEEERMQRSPSDAGSGG